MRVSVIRDLKNFIAAGLFLTATSSLLAQPVNDNFASATVISGAIGTTAGNNQGATMQTAVGELPSVAITAAGHGTVDVTNSVWYQWTAQQNGNVTFDTIGSLDNTFNPMATVVSIWSGSSLSNLVLVAADDYSGDGTNTSKITFFAVAGTVYYVSVDLNADRPGLPGNYVLNWNEQGAPNSGTFNLTSGSYVYSDQDSPNIGARDPRGLMTVKSARATITRSGGADGAVDIGYVASEGIYQEWVTTNIYIVENLTAITDTNNVLLGYTNVITYLYNITSYYQNYNPNNNGLYTRYYQSADMFNYTNFNGTIVPGVVSNDIPFVTNPPVVFVPNPQFTYVTNTDTITVTANYFTNGYAAITNYTTTYTGTPVINPSAALTNGSLIVSTGQAIFPDFEMNVDIDVTPPTSPPYNSPLPDLENNVLFITLTNVALDPLEDPTLVPPPTLGSSSNTIVTFLSTSGADLDKGPFGSGGTTNYLYNPLQAATNLILNFERSTIACDKTVTGSGVAYVYITLNTGPGNTAETAYYHVDFANTSDDNNTFTLQPGSDYARPDNATQYTATNDFTSSTLSGSVTFPANMAPPYQELIAIPITQDGEVKFNRDIHLQLYWPIGVTHDALIGNVSTCALTILHTTPPAGAVDSYYNPENNPETLPPFNSLPGANGEVNAVVIQPTDGKAVIGGQFTGYNHVEPNGQVLLQNHIARINTTGQMDTSFYTGQGFDRAVLGLAVDANANIVAVGSFNSFNGAPVSGIARLLPNGSLDSTFNPGYGANNTIRSTLIQPDGKIVIVGDFTSYNLTNANHIARLNPNGSLDGTFNAGVGPDGKINSVALLTNGGFVIGGQFTNIDGMVQKNLACLNADGSLNTSFNISVGADSQILSVAVQTNGQILIGGDFTLIGSLPAGPGIARLNTDGSVDSSFTVGTGPDDVVNCLTLQPDGGILVGGIFKSINQTRRVSVARLLSNGWVDTSFMDTAHNQFAGLPNTYYDPAVNPPNPVNAIAVQADGGVIIGGLFSAVGGDGLPVNFVGSGTVANDRDVMHARNNLARLIGGTTPGPGNLGLVYQTYSVNASSPSYYVSVLRTNGSLGTVSATFEAVPLGYGPGYAANGVDYSLSPTIANWPNSYSNPTWMQQDGLTGPNYHEVAINGQVYSGNTAVTLNIISNNNANSTLNIGMTQPQIMDTFSLGGENIPLAVALGNASAPLTIVRNNVHPGVFNLSQTYYYVAENAGNMVVTVTRTSGSDNRVTVKYATSNGTALAGTDYTTKSGTLTFNAGVTSQTFSVPITSGTIARPDRVFNVSISTPGGGATLGTVTNAQIEIVNNNVLSGFATFIGGIAVNANLMAYGTNENTSPAFVSVARLGGTSGQLSLSLATTNGTAINGVNYIGLTNSLTWTNGDASVKTIPVAVLDDNVVTSNLTVKLTLYNATWNGLSTTNLFGLYTNSVLTITNVDSVGAVEFTAPSYTVNENAGYAIIPIVRTGGSSGLLAVSYTNINGTAAAGVHYAPVGGQFTFGQGQVSTNIIVGITNLNTTWSSPLNFLLALSNAVPTNGLGMPNVAQVNINGSSAFNNPPGNPDTQFYGYGFNGPVSSLALQTDGKILAGGSFTQADGVARQRIARLKPDGSLDQTFSSYLTAYGASDAVRSILVESNGLIVVAGLFTNFNSTTLNHIARLNVNGSLDSSFSPGSGSDNPIYALGQTYVNGQLRLVLGGSFTVYNGTPANNLVVLLANGFADGTVDPSFNAGVGPNGTVFAVAVQPDNKIIIGGDFTTVNGQPFNHLARLYPNGSVDTTFNPGSGASDSVRALALQLDGKILVGGLFSSINGTNANHLARLNQDGSVDGTFVPGLGANGNVNTISLQSDTRIMVGGDFTTYNGVTRNHITRLNPDGTTDYTINFGIGTDGSVAATVVQPDGNIVLGGAFQNYEGHPYPDIVRIYGGSTSGSGAFQFSSATYQADENGVSALVTVVRTGGTAGPNANGAGNITVPFGTSDITAVHTGPHPNYSQVATNLSFPPGEVIRTVAIPVFDDGIITPNLLVGLTISNSITPPGQIGNQPTATLTILNDDSGIGFSSANFTAPKNIPGNQALVYVNRYGSSVGIASVYFSTGTGGTALPVTDYTPITNQLVTFSPGVSNVLVLVPINNNGIPEGNQTVKMSITNASGSVLISPTNAVLTIIDTVNAYGELSFASTNYSANASDGSASITLLRSGGLSGSVSVTITNLPVTAMLGVNYVNSSGTVTFADGESSKTFLLPLINSSIPQQPVTLGMALLNPSGGASLGVTTNAYLTINNTNVGVAFGTPTNTIPETAGTALLYVQRFGNTNGTLTVGYYTSRGTAKAGLNYVNTTSTVTFFPGETLKPAVVTLLDDPAVTGDLNFFVALTNSSLVNSIISPSFTTVVEQDADAGLNFASSTNTVFKNAGSVTITVICSNPRVEPPIVSSNSVPLQVNYYTVDGTAQAGQDYQGVSGTLVFTNGMVTNSFIVPIKNNGLITGNKTFSLVLTNATAPGQVTSPATETVTIAESNAGLQFSASKYSIFKNGVSANINVYRTGFTDSVVSVSYIATNGTAVNGQNFIATNGALVFTNGVTVQSFSVPLLTYNQIQPNLTVLLQLANPVNGYLVAPSAATLTILENSGSYVIPAGAQVINNYSSGLNNGIIGPNDTVQVQFAFRDSAGLNVTNLYATLLATNGVLAPSATQNYGPLTLYGHSVSRPFTFTANGTNGLTISPTFTLSDNAKSIGTAAFTFIIGTSTNIFANTNVIIINDNTNASPYPSAINVSGVGGSLIKATVTLNHLSHTSPQDIDALLVSPAGLNSLFMAHVGGQYTVTNILLNFDDAATNYLPRYGQLSSGTNKPTSFLPVRNFP